MGSQRKRKQGSAKTVLTFEHLSAQEQEYVRSLRDLASSEDDSGRVELLKLISQQPDRAAILAETLRRIIDACPELLEPETRVAALLTRVREAILKSTKISIFMDKVVDKN